MPASWTDVEGPDPILVLSEGRSWFRVDDLVTLADLLPKLMSGRRK